MTEQPAAYDGQPVQITLYFPRATITTNSIEEAALVWAWHQPGGGGLATLDGGKMALFIEKMGDRVDDLDALVSAAFATGQRVVTNMQQHVPGYHIEFPGRTAAGHDVPTRWAGIARGQAGSKQEKESKG